MSNQGLYNGKHYTEYVETVKSLKRKNKLDEAIFLLKNLVLAVEEEARSKNWDIAPWYYEQLAIIYRKQKDYSSEIRILERYFQNKKDPETKPPDFVKRLEKAKFLEEKQGLRK